MNETAPNELAAVRHAQALAAIRTAAIRTGILAADARVVAGLAPGIAAPGEWATAWHNYTTNRAKLLELIGETE